MIVHAGVERLLADKLIIYTVEETEDGVWSVMDWNGLRVLGLQDEKEAEFYCTLMNLVYHEVMDDVKRELTE